MEFETDPLVEELARNEKRETFGLIICALFHQPKPIAFAEFYHRLIERFQGELTDDDKQAVYLYPIEHLHITVATLVSFKNPPPTSTEHCLNYWKKAFETLKKTSRNRPVRLVVDKIELSSAAGFFRFRDDSDGIRYLRQSIRECCQPEEGQAKLHIPNIIHTSFLRFVKKPINALAFEQTFHRICQDLFRQTTNIFVDIDEVCLASETHPYMHIECDSAHILDVMKC